ncbi:MAG: NAD(P)H-hydrate dehydratase [Gemmataceae bacterium]
MSQSVPKLVTEVPILPPRNPESHKGTFGKVLVVAGSRGMTGAAVLCGTAALRSGAGLVRVATPKETWPVVAMGYPSYTTIPLPQDGAGRLSGSCLETLIQHAKDNDVVAIGPGLGQSEDLKKLVPSFLQESPVPVVVDADGLNAFVGQTDQLRNSNVPIMITPHPGEFARLAGVPVQAIESDVEEKGNTFALSHALIVVLKRHETIVTDGEQLYRNTTGNAGMATGGSGDVLTGMVAALVAQKMSPFAAAQLGVYVHGLAGDLARDALGEVSMTSADILDFLPPAFQQL